MQDAQALGLGHVAREHLGIQVVDLEPGGDGFRRVLGVGEHQAAGRILLAQQMHQQRNLLLDRRVVQRLRDLVGGALVRLDAHELRIVHVLVGELGNAVGKRGREQHAQARGGRRHAPQQETDVLDEAEVEHAVGLVEHHHLHRLEVEHTLLEVIDDAPGRADQHVHALFQHAPLRVVTGTAEDETQPESGVRAQRHGILVNLHRQFARRREHDRTRLRRTAVFRQVRQQIIEGGEQERRGLAGAGLRLAGDILPGQCQRQGLGLDRRAEFETGLAHALKQGLGQVKAGEGLAGKVVITHKTGAPSISFCFPGGTFEMRQCPTCIPRVFLPKLLPITRSRQPTASQSGRTSFNDYGGKQHMSHGIVNISDDSFEEEVLKAEGPVLVDYWAEWCGPCKIIAPVLQEIATEYRGKLKVAKLNIDENPQTPPKYGIRGIPTLMLFKNGSVEATKVGAVSKSQLAAFIDGNL